MNFKEFVNDYLTLNDIYEEEPDRSEMLWDFVNDQEYLTTKFKEWFLHCESESLFIPKFLYHATYGAYFDSISKLGLIPRFHCTWNDCENGVFLANDPSEAESFAEVAPDENPNIPEEYLDDIIILKIDTSKLNQFKFKRDPHVKWNENPQDFSTYIYYDTIPVNAILNIQNIKDGLKEAVGYHATKTEFDTFDIKNPK